MKYGKLYKLSVDNDPNNSCYVYDISKKDWPRFDDQKYTLEYVYVHNNDYILYIEPHPDKKNMIFLHLKSNKFIVPNKSEIKEI